MELETVLKERRTVRKFSQKMIPEHELRHLVDMARRASCARNDQRLRYIIVRTPETVNAVFEQTAWAGAVTPRRNPVPGVTSPTAFIIVAGKSDEAETPLLQADSGAAIQTIQLAAWEKEIGCCWIGSVDRKKVHSILEMSADMAILYVIALGYAAERPLSEDTDDPRQVKYYLDENDLLHVPKLSVDAITSWK